MTNCTKAPAAISSEGQLLFSKGQTPKELQEKLESQDSPNLMNGAYLSAAYTMAEWSKLRQIYYGKGGALGLCEDGTILEAGLLGIGLTEENWSVVQSWKDLKDLVVLHDGSEIAGLDVHGNVYGVGNEFDTLVWENIVSIESGDRMLFGLTEDGRVVYTAFGFGKEYSTDAMKDIVFIVAGYSQEEEIDVVYGITREGKVVDRFGKELSGFVDIVEIDVSPMRETIVFGLKDDGTVCVSENADENMKEVITAWNRKD